MSLCVIIYPPLTPFVRWLSFGGCCFRVR